MKIKKLIESKLIEADEEKDTSIDTTGTTSEIADDIKDAVDELSDGNKEISDAAAERVAQETADTADVVGASEAVIVIDDKDWEDVTITNGLYKALDRSWRTAKANMGKHSMESNANILVEGLPGSGKTAVVNAWCRMNGLTMVKMNATDPKIEAAINGLPLRDLDSDDESNAEIRRTKLTYAYAIDDNTGVGLLLNDKHPELAGKCILFVDEFNRQLTAQLRKPFMEIFNAKKNANGTLDFTKNLLFCVVAINPFGNDFHDKGVAELNAAENDRFLRHLTLDSNINDAEQFWNWYRASELLNLGILAPGSRASLNHNGWIGPTKDLDEDDLAHAKRVIKMSELALYILKNVHKSREVEIFTTRKDADATYRGDVHGHDYHYVTARGLFEGISDSTVGDDKSPVKDFLDWVDEESKYTPAKCKMFHDILDSYIMDVKGLFDAYNLGKTPKEIKSELDGVAIPKDVTADTTSEDEVEDDDVMFGDDDLGSVSKASVDDLGTDDIDSIMNSWDH